MSDSPPGRTCPSSDAGDGSTVLGILGPHGRVVYTPRGAVVTDALRNDLASPDSPLESRFRFAGPCVEAACAFWNGSCRALDAAHEDFDSAVPPDDTADLPRCGIRDTCRWWHQEGQKACRVCPFVRTRAVPT